MLVVVSLVALMVQVFSLGYMHGEPGTVAGALYTYQSLFLFSMQLLVIAPISCSCSSAGSSSAPRAICSSGSGTGSPAPRAQR